MNTSFTPDQVLDAVKANMTSDKKVNTKPHCNSQTNSPDGPDVNVYQVADGFFAFTSGMAIDTDGSDPDPDPDHQPNTTWPDDEGNHLGAHRVPYYVLGDFCFDNQTPCKWFYYAEHNIQPRQFALIFYGDKCIGALFGDTQGGNAGDPDDPCRPEKDPDARELGEASVKSAELLGIPASGTGGGVPDGVTYVVCRDWVVHGTNSTLNDNAQALIQKALDKLGQELNPGSNGNGQVKSADG